MWDKSIMADRRVKLVYPPQLVDQPILYDFIQNFGLMTSIRQADVNQQGGWLLIQVRGDEAIIGQAFDWLRQLGIEVQELAA